MYILFIPFMINVNMGLNNNPYVIMPLKKETDNGLKITTTDDKTFSDFTGDLSVDSAVCLRHFLYDQSHYFVFLTFTHNSEMILRTSSLLWKTSSFSFCSRGM